MYRFWPFSKDRAASEAGNMLLIVGMIGTATAVVGGKVMLDRVTAQRKAALMAEQTKRSKEIPGSAAMIAKALISLPRVVAQSKTDYWKSDLLKDHADYLPLIYPVPYVSGAIGASAEPATSVAQSIAPAAGANWDTLAVSGTTLSDGTFASANVNVYTNDSTRATAQDINSAIANRSAAGGNATIKRTKSVVTYSFRNCTAAGVVSPTFTGRYCATADIASDNYASAIKGSTTLAGSPNKGVVDLGVIEPPPPPFFDSSVPIVTPGKAPVKPGATFSLNVSAFGVAVGYRIRLVSPAVGGAASILSYSGDVPLHLPWDQPRLSRAYTIANISTADPSVTAALNQPSLTEMTVEVGLRAIDGTYSTVNVIIQLDKPIVACEAGSFAVNRTGSDLRSCTIDLKKTTGGGIVKQVKITQTNATSGITSETILAATFSGNNWSASLPCSQDGWTFNAFLKREYPAGTPVAQDSQCSPQRVVSELEPQCDLSSPQNKNPARLAPPPSSNLLKCSVTVVRTAASHTDARVIINGADQTALASWSSNVWTATIPCSGTSFKVKAELKKDSIAKTCVDATVDAESAACNANSTNVSRKAGDPSMCIVTLTRSGASSQYVDVKVNDVLRAGTWSVNNWESNAFACDLGAGDFKATLTAADGVPADCGTKSLPAAPPSCTLVSADRLDPTSLTCKVTLEKTATSGPVQDVLLNGVAVAGSWTGSSWEGQTACDAAGVTIKGEMRNSAGVTAACGQKIIPSSQCSSAPEQREFIARGNLATSNLILVDSEDRSCYKYISAVCIGGGGGGRNAHNGDDDNGGGGGALAWFANRLLVDTDTYQANGGRAGPYGGPGGPSFVTVNGLYIINAENGFASSAGGVPQFPAANPTATWIGREVGVTFGGGAGGTGGSAKQVGGWLAPGGGGGAGGYSGKGGNGANGESGSGVAGAVGAGAGGGGGTGCEGAGKGGGVSLYGKGSSGAGGGVTGSCKNNQYGQPGKQGSPYGTPGNPAPGFGGGSGGPAENNTFRYSDPGACRVIFSKTQWDWLIQH